MKSLVVFIIVHLSVVMSLWDVNSHRLLFQSEKDKISVVSKSGEISYKQDIYDIHPEYINKLKDRGHATNCGNPAHNFSLTWDPKVVNPSREVVFYLDMIAATEFVSGSVEVAVSTGGSYDPFITDTVPLNCALIHMKFKQLKCPMEKGDHINISYTVSDMSALPPGSYKLKANIKDSDQKDFLCALLEVEIKE